MSTFKVNPDILAQAGENISMEDIMGPELGSILDRNLWQETVEIQKAFNDSVAPGWVEDPKYDYWMAILDETVEVLNSKHWKWWKDKNKMGQVDWNNIEVELVDLFLFTLSQAIREGQEEVVYVTLASTKAAFEASGGQVRDAKFFDDFWEQFLMSVSLKTLPLLIVKWAEFWFRSGGSIDRLMMQYRVKAALNDIRQEFGYAKGTYQKIWNGQEDNVIAWEIAEDVPLDADTTKVLTEKLREYYLENVAI